MAASSSSAAGRWMKGVIVFFLALFFSVATNADTPAEAAPMQWKMGCPVTRYDTQPGLRMFCELVEKYSDGKISIRYYPDSQLGTYPEHLNGCIEGSIEIILGTAYTTMWPGVVVQEMPYMINDMEEYRILFRPRQGMLWKLMDDALAEGGTRHLFSTSQGLWGVASKVRPIRSPADFNSLKMRGTPILGYTRAMQNIAEGQKLQFESVPWADIYDALSKGVVDTLLTHGLCLVDDRHAEVTNYYTDLGVALNNDTVMINAEVLESLPSELQEAVYRAAGETHEWLTTEMTRQLTLHRTRIEKEFGHFAFIDLTPEEKAAFVKQCRPEEIWEECLKPWLDGKYPDQGMYSKLLEEVQRVRDEVAGAPAGPKQ